MNINDFNVKLFEAIGNKNAQESLILVQQAKESIKTDVEYVIWITEPQNLGKIQKSLTENLGIPQKAMMIKPRPGTSRGLRAMFFLQAMENSLKKIT